MNFSWTALERVYVDKKSDWYITVWIISITCIVLAILFNNILIATLILVATIALTLNAHRKPKRVMVEINSKGIRKDDLFFPWSSFISFWIEEEDVAPKLLLESKRRLLPHLVLLIDESEINIDELREFISSKLEEFEQHEPLLERVFERLGF